MSNNFDLDDEAIIEALTDLFYGYYETENIQDSIEAVLSDCSINEDTTVEDSLYILDSNLIPATVGLFAEKWSRLTEEHDSDLNATFDTSTKSLQWTVTYEGLSGPATAAHFHGPAPVGQNAKVQVPIGKDALASPIKGSAALTEQQVTDLMAGQWYFNVHTEQNPTGEIRGQVLPAN